MPIAGLKFLRKQKKITQKQLSEQAGIPLRTIINYENGLRQPNAKSLAALGRYFEVGADDLLGDLSATKQQKFEMDFIHTLFNDEEDEQDLRRLLNAYMQLGQQGRKELMKRAEEMVQPKKCNITVNALYIGGNRQPLRRVPCAQMLHWSIRATLLTFFLKKHFVFCGKRPKALPLETANL